MISGIASPLIASPPTMPPAGPTGRCRASTAPSNSAATRAASLNDMAASGPPSDTARIDLIIAHTPPKDRPAGFGARALLFHPHPTQTQPPPPPPTVGLS